MMKKNYLKQKEMNVDSFKNYIDFDKRRNALKKLCDAFKTRNWNWALAWSAGLFFRGIVDDFHDLDIVIESITEEQMRNFLAEIGAIIESEYNDSCFTTKVFFRCSIDGVEMDIMSDFGMKVNDIDYHLVFSTDDIDIINIDGMMIPVYAAEVQYLLYAILADSWQKRRHYKRQLIAEYLSENMCKPEILEYAENIQLPKWIKGEMNFLLYMK